MSARPRLAAVDRPDVAAEILAQLRRIGDAQERIADALENRVLAAPLRIEKSAKGITVIPRSIDLHLARQIARTTQSGRFTTKDLVTAALLRDGGELRAALVDAIGSIEDGRSIGGWLSGFWGAGTELDGLRVQQVGKDHGAAVWIVAAGS